MKKYEKKFNLNEVKSIPQGFDKLLSKIEKLTDYNNHGEARLEIASFFKHKKYIDIFTLVNKIHDIERSLPMKLGHYREDVYDEMLKLISKEYGEDIAKQINSKL